MVCRGGGKRERRGEACVIRHVSGSIGWGHVGRSVGVACLVCCIHHLEQVFDPRLGRGWDESDGRE